MLLSLLLAASAKPDILLIVLDDVSWMDYQAVETPNMDALADDGVLFSRAYAQPWCRPTRRAILFSLWDGSSPGSMCKAPRPESLPEMQSFASMLLGYETSLFGKWHLGNNQDPGFTTWQTPTLHGFDTWRAGVPDNVLNPSCPPSQDYTQWRRVDDGNWITESKYNTQAIYDEWLGWWSSTGGKRFSMVCFQAAHAPFHLPPSNLMPSSYTAPVPFGPRDGFEALIVSLDHVLGMMMESVDDETWVIVVGDNGTPNDALGPNQTADKVKHSTFEGGVRVPLIVRGPGVVPGVYDGPVHVADIMPTMAGVTASMMTQGRDGISFFNALVGGEAPRDWTYVSTVRGNPAYGTAGQDEAIIERRWKLREHLGVQELYDLLYDPLEQYPLDPDDAAYASIAGRLRLRLAEAR